MAQIRQSSRNQHMSGCEEAVNNNETIGGSCLLSVAVGRSRKQGAYYVGQCGYGLV